MKVDYYTVHWNEMFDCSLKGECLIVHEKVNVLLITEDKCLTVHWKECLTVHWKECLTVHWKEMFNYSLKGIFDYSLKWNVYCKMHYEGKER